MAEILTWTDPLWYQRFVGLALTFGCTSAFCLIIGGMWTSDAMFKSRQNSWSGHPYPPEPCMSKVGRVSLLSLGLLCAPPTIVFGVVAIFAKPVTGG